MYIPISNIVSNGYTNGGEFIFKSNFQPYTGFYFIDKNNNVYTGETYTNSSVELLRIDIPSNQSPNSDPIYVSLDPKILPPLSIEPDFIQPTENDYNNGYFTRFILKPTISTLINDFIEVNFDKYVSVVERSDARILYKSVGLAWKLTGLKHDLYKNNIRISPGIIDSNKRSITEAEKTLPNLSLYFTDLTQFGRPS